MGKELYDTPESTIVSRAFYFKPQKMDLLTVTSNVPNAVITLNGVDRVVPGGGGYTTACSLCVDQTFSVAPSQTVGGTRYCFDTWSDDGFRQHAVKLSFPTTLALSQVTSGSGPTTYDDDVVLKPDITDCRSPHVFEGIANAPNGLTIYPGTTMRFSRGGGQSFYGHLRVWKYLAATNVTFESTNSASDPPGSWIGLEMVDPAGGTISLTDCTIRNAITGVGAVVEGGHVTAVTLDGCGFTKNNTDVELDYLDGMASGKSVRLAHNYFTAKTAVRIQGADQASNPYVVAAIDSNTFASSQSNTAHLKLTGGFSGHLYNNVVGLSGANSKGIDLAATVGGYPNLVLQNNVFQYASGRTALIAPVVGSATTLSAIYNNWSVFSYGEIENIITHYGTSSPDATNRATVVFSPFNTGGGAGGGGCPYILTENSGEYLVENSILGRGEYRGAVGPPVWDAVEVKRLNRDGRMSAKIRIREMASDVDVLDEVRLVAVKVPEGVSLSTDASGAVTAYREVAALTQVRAWTGRNSPFISPIAPASAYRGEPGDSLEFEVGPSGGPVIGRRIGVSLVPKPQESRSIGGRVGVTLRVSRDLVGTQWETLGEVVPKEEWSSTLLSADASSSSPIRRVRVVWNTPHTLGWAGVVEAVPAGQRELHVLSAVHSDGTDASGAVGQADGKTVTLKGHEHVELEYAIGDLEPQEHVVVVARGYYTGAATVSKAVIPVRAFASQNRPNPFNPRTEIDFGLPAKGLVSIRIFDVNGRLVRTLADREFPAGIHTVAWDGRSQAGGEAASGVYFYQASLPDQTIRRRMVLLR